MSTDFEYVSNLYNMRTRKANEFPWIPQLFGNSFDSTYKVQ